ncbi:MAG: TAXI family TRAP transporter solute-binding subunit, partial [Lachnospiraceae bacterium]|nr:TAXI family TRAP transporter solute-binding subunit [Lachnospiraceae bacterium]
TPLVYEGENGTGWAESAGRTFEGITALFPCYPSAFACYTLADSGIESIADLEGKSVCLGPAGSSYNWQLKIYEACGVEIKPVSLAWADAVNALKDGTVDACSFSGAHPFASCTEIQLTNEVRFLPLPEEALEKLVEADPTRPIVTIDADTYTYMTEEYKTLCEYSFFMCNKDLPEDVAYAITKICVENSDILNLAVAAAKDIDPEKLGNITTAKLHPGAYKYYQEIGAEIPEWMVPEE